MVSTQIILDRLLLLLQLLLLSLLLLSLLAAKIHCLPRTVKWVVKPPLGDTTQ